MGAERLVKISRAICLPEEGLQDIQKRRWSGLIPGYNRQDRLIQEEEEEYRCYKIFLFFSWCYLFSLHFYFPNERKEN